MDQAMKMVGQDRPGVDRHGAGLGQAGQPADDVGPLPVIPQDRAAFDPARHRLVDDAGGIEAGAAGLTPVRHKATKAATYPMDTSPTPFGDPNAQSRYTSRRWRTRYTSTNAPTIS